MNTTAAFYLTVAGLLAAASAPAATINALATVTCNTNSVTTFDSTALNGTNAARCENSFSLFTYNDWSVEGNFSADPRATPGLPPGLNTVRATLSLLWSGQFLLAGGTGTAELDLGAYYPGVFNYAQCSVAVDAPAPAPQGGPCAQSVTVPFNVPFAINIRISGDVLAGTPYYSGSARFSLSPNSTVRQGGILLSGTQLTLVPEPATWTMMGLAAGLLGWRRHRRRAY